jgi:hypothetical protein
VSVDVDELRQRIAEFRDSHDEYFDNWVTASTVETLLDEIVSLRERVAEPVLKGYGYVSPFRSYIIAFAYDLESAMQMLETAVNEQYDASEHVREWQVVEFDIPAEPKVEIVS